MASAPAVSSVLAIMDSRSKNSGVIDTDGLDLSARYRFDTSFGTLTAGADATYVMHYKTAPVPTATIVEQVNNFTYPLKWRARFNFGWQKGGWSALAYVNYSNPYNIPRSQLPPTSPDQYLSIASYTTVDLTLRYDTGDGEGAFRNIALTLNATNLFDKDPPLVLNLGTTPVRFDPQNASPLGRVVSAQITKRW